VYDIAGLTRGASTGAGLGNSFLSHIRAVDAIFQVVRCFDDAEIIHVEGDVDPVRDLTIISEELRIKDIEFVEKALDGLSKQTRRGGQSLEMKKMKEDEATTAKILEWLKEGKNIRDGDWSPKEVRIFSFFSFPLPIYSFTMMNKRYKREINPARRVPSFYNHVRGHIEKTSYTEFFGVLSFWNTLKTVINITADNNGFRSRLSTPCSCSLPSPLCTWST